jgi:ketosteroid isomerase-like protein
MRMPTATSNLERARNYLRAIEQGATGEAIAKFFDPAVMQEEFPNRLMPNGARRDLSDLLLSTEQGRKLLSSQSYEIHNELENGDCVALEVTWVGTLKVPFQNLPAGSSLRARFAVFLEFREGRIVAQRNYDCFDPW